MLLWLESTRSVIAAALAPSRAQGAGHGSTWRNCGTDPSDDGPSAHRLRNLLVAQPEPHATISAYRPIGHLDRPASTGPGHLHATGIRPVQRGQRLLGRRVS